MRGWARAGGRRSASGRVREGERVRGVRVWPGPHAACAELRGAGAPRSLCIGVQPSAYCKREATRAMPVARNSRPSLPASAGEARAAQPRRRACATDCHTPSPRGPGSPHGTHPDPAPLRHATSRVPARHTALVHRSSAPRRRARALRRELRAASAVDSGGGPCAIAASAPSRAKAKGRRSDRSRAMRRGWNAAGHGRRCEQEHAREGTCSGRARRRCEKHPSWGSNPRPHG